MADKPPVKLTAQVEVSAPFHASDLVDFISAIPSDAEVQVSVYEDGQRDPVPRKYIFTANWPAPRKGVPLFDHPTPRGGQ